MGDIVDRAGVLEEAHREASLNKHRLSVPLRPVNSTGLCCMCGKAIEAKRLKIDPTVIRCIGCQTTHEEFEKRRGR